MPADPPLTLGTAGHIDHGKTALVAALTGVDTDRLPHEKSRGISIELGYAPLELPGGRRLSVVDVPGHERFVRTMVAGATGIDLFLLVVAADDGVMPQTREHEAILELLGIPRGVVAITKRDLVDDELATLARLSVDELLDGGPYERSEVVEVSARTGAGLDELRAALDRIAGAAGSRAAAGPVRLPVDRSFSLRGIGTVVTGTLWSGTVSSGDRVAIEPGGREARVRSVQVHDAPVECAAAGQRVALALTGVERAEVARGHTIASPGLLRMSYRLDCDLAVPTAAGRSLAAAQPVTVHHGTAEVPAKVAIRTGGELAPGTHGRAQLRLARPLAALEGDRVIVRLTAPAMTVAGGVVLDRAPSRSPRRPPAPPPQAVPAAPSAPAGAVDALYRRIAGGGLAPPPLADGDDAAAAVLVRDGRAVRAGRDLLFAADAFSRAAAEVAALGMAGPITLAGTRDRLGISRRYAQGLLEAMDAQGITRRVGDERVLRRRGRDLAGS